MLSKEIKIETSSNHQQLEKKIISGMRAMQNINDYAMLLQAFYTYFGGLENLIKLNINIMILPDYDERRKVNLLASDLYALGAHTLPLAGIKYLPKITNNAQSLGALYVIEGSTLGGQIIKKIIGKQLGIEDGAVMSFFNGYGEHTSRMWDIFKDVLDQNNNSETKDTIIAAANETFQKFSEWFDIYYKN